MLLHEAIIIIEKHYQKKTSLQHKIETTITDDDYNQLYNKHKLALMHLIEIRPVEIIMFEFKEILLELALTIKGR